MNRNFFKNFIESIVERRAPSMKTDRRPLIVVRRDERIKWTPEDSRVMADFMDGTTWKKFEKMTEDSVICDLLPERGEPVKDMTFFEPYAAGRMKQVEFMYAHANRKRVPLANVGTEPEETDQGKDDESWPIQREETGAHK